MNRLAIACTIACLSATSAGAQARVASPLTAAAPVAGPLRSAAVAGIVTAPVLADSALVPYQPGVKNRGKPVALMVAGAAAFVGGLIIGDGAGTLIAAGGVGMAVYGIYLYAR